MTRPECASLQCLRENLPEQDLRLQCLLTPSFGHLETEGPAKAAKLGGGDRQVPGLAILEFDLREAKARHELADVPERDHGEGVTRRSDELLKQGVVPNLFSLEPIADEDMPSRPQYAEHLRIERGLVSDMENRVLAEDSIETRPGKWQLAWLYPQVREAIVQLERASPRSGSLDEALVDVDADDSSGAEVTSEHDICAAGAAPKVEEAQPSNAQPSVR